MERFPEMTDLLKGREDATWDFFGTVAAVGLGMCLAYRAVDAPVLNLVYIPEDEVFATEKAVARVLNEWDSQGYQAYVDFCGFVARGVEGGSKPEVVVGAWVVWNIKGSEPSKKEFEVGAVIGSMFFASMAGAWR